MAWLTEILKNPQNWVTAVGLFFLGLMFDHYKDLVKKEFTNVKDDNFLTRKKLNEHGIQMTEFSMTIMLLKSELIKEVEIIMVHINNVEKNLDSVARTIGNDARQMENGSEFISLIKAELEHIHGSIKLVDIKTEEARGDLMLHKNSLDKVFEILRSHNVQIKVKNEKT